MNPHMMQLRPVGGEKNASYPLGQEHFGNYLLAALPPDLMARLSGDMQIVALAQGTVLFNPGEPIEHIYFPQSGLVSLMVISRDGDAIESATVGREGAIGLHRALGGRRSFTRAAVQVAGHFSTISAAKLEPAIAASAAAREVITDHTELLWAEVQQLAACNALHDAASRLCRSLLQAADRVGRDQLPLTQESLATALGVRRTSVTLLAQALQKKGIIRYSRGMIQILDRPQLEACACECYHVMKGETLSAAIGLRPARR
jgi:CRP-like cAMP-binding protein